MRIGIILITYNRLDMIERVLPALLKCRGLNKFPVHIAQDGGIEASELIDYMTPFIETAKWTRCIAEQRRGLPVNMSEGINEFVQQKNLDAIITMEDDVLISKDFLEYMEWALNKFKNDPDIGVISSYSNETEDLPDNQISFRKPVCFVSSAMFRNNWDSFYEYWKEHGCYKQKIWTWDFVLMNYMIVNKKIVVYPRQSRSSHIGWYGTNVIKENKIGSTVENPVGAAAFFKEDHRVKEYKILKSTKEMALSETEKMPLIPDDDPYVDNMRGAHGYI